MTSTVGFIGKEVCTWTCDHEGVWSAACGLEGWCFEGGSPSENGYKFCHSCGKPIRIVESAEESDND